MRFPVFDKCQYKHCGFRTSPYIVRRGDVTTKCIRAKWIEDEVYIQVAKTVQAMLPHSSMHLFSTAHGSWKKTIGPSDFVKWQHAGFHKHLDNPNIDDMAMLPFALS